jgi:hypothetical protein
MRTADKIGKHSEARDDREKATKHQDFSAAAALLSIDDRCLQLDSSEGAKHLDTAWPWW